MNTSELYYDGNSQGGIFGGITTAVSPDIRRAVLGVTGEDYANSLVQRSTDFGSPTTLGSFSWLLWNDYADNNSARYTLTLDLMDQLWDRADPVGYVQGLGATSVRRHAVPLGADADRLRRPPGQHVRRRRRGALDRRRRLRARRNAGLGTDHRRRPCRQRTCSTG